MSGSRVRRGAWSPTGGGGAGRACGAPGLRALSRVSHTPGRCGVPSARGQTGTGARQAELQSWNQPVVPQRGATVLFFFFFLARPFIFLKRGERDLVIKAAFLVLGYFF